MASESAYQEFTGKSVEEALKIACETFKVGLADLDFEIIAPGSKGVLGMGAEPARIVAAPASAIAGSAPKRSTEPAPRAAAPRAAAPRDAEPREAAPREAAGAGSATGAGGLGESSMTSTCAGRVGARGISRVFDGSVAERLKRGAATRPARGEGAPGGAAPGAVGVTSPASA